MKKVIRVITVLAIVASFSSSAYAKTNGWDFLNTLFTGKGLNQNCTSINASPAQIMATKGNVSGMTITDKNGDKRTYTTTTNE